MVYSVLLYFIWDWLCVVARKSSKEGKKWEKRLGFRSFDVVFLIVFGCGRRVLLIAHLNQVNSVFCFLVFYSVSIIWIGLALYVFFLEFSMCNMFLCLHGKHVVYAIVSVTWILPLIVLRLDHIIPIINLLYSLSCTRSEIFMTEDSEGIIVVGWILVRSLTKSWSVLFGS